MVDHAVVEFLVDLQVYGPLYNTIPEAQRHYEAALRLRDVKLQVPPSERLFEVGMPIGNLTSQLLANVCLNELDQYVKHELRARYYVRYMDDMVLLHQDAKVLNEWRVLIEDYLNNVLHLELNSKTAIGLVCRGVTFVGCRIYPLCPFLDSLLDQPKTEARQRRGYAGGDNDCCYVHVFTS